MDVTVVRNEDAGSYDAIADEQVVGRLVYQRRDDRVVVRSTVVEPRLRGQGVASTLVRAALDDIRAEGLPVTNHCWFVTRFVAANPDYAGVVDIDMAG